MQQQRTILLVEDDRAIRRFLQVTLQRAGYEVLLAADGLEALKALHAINSTPIDAVVTDAVMPHLDGHQLCRFIRRTETLAQIPIIMLSGMEAAAPAADEKKLADAHLSKPVRPEELTACLAKLLPR